jgi:ABC-type branched-subunit amino acid transport system substrate-binding protein
LTGRYALQGVSMGAGLAAWARDTGRELRREDDESDPRSAARVHAELVAAGCRPVLGPYGSDTTRAVARGSGGPVWNHGAAADDVQRLPGVVSVPTPSSRYLVAVARAAIELYGASRVAVLAAPGAFARFAREGLEREAAALGLRLVRDPNAADCVLLCGSVEWEAERFRELARVGVVLGGVSPGLPDAPPVWPEGTLAPVQWHPDLGGPPSVTDYVAAQAYAAALVAARCLELDPVDPSAAAHRLSTTTFFGRFELDRTGLQVGHRLSVIRRRAGGQELVLADAA